ncbi:Kre5 protein [Saccharomycopsis crataegensis]|uniref:Kre5 protein n=1 Tax=Saccharomycopsis crataegensis TaxID=43959 RepID=A0AAV5QLT8_9ASCO|nr:Kre5 protein [Saccharomycopsis crataegensis]
MFGPSSWLPFLVTLLNLGLGLGFEDNSVNIKVEANWKQTPFRLQLLETIAASNHSLYIPAVGKVLQLELTEDSEDEFDSDLVDPLTDEEYYTKITELFGDHPLGVEAKGFFDVYLANNYHSPRIVSHLSHYNGSVIPELKDKLLKCTSDFDSPELKTTRGKQLPKSWVYYNGEILCNPNDIFALKTTSDASDDQLLLPFDRIIGTNDAAPLAILYGDIEDPQLREYFFHLFQSSKSDKLRFVWRYADQNLDGPKEALGGYGVDLTLKRTDYIVIDDRDIKKDANIKNLDGKDNEQVILNDELVEETSSSALGFLNKTYDKINGVSKKKLKSLDLKVANYILNKHDGDGFSKFQLLKDILENFPKYAHDIATSDYFKFSKKSDKYQTFMESFQENQEIGVGNEMKGIYVNGKELDDTEYSLYGLLDLIQKESSYISDFGMLNLSPIASKGFISEFARLCTVASAKSAGAGNSQRYNIHEAMKSDTISGEKIIYINDLETDADYADFTLNRNLWLNFDAARQGKFPEYKENVLEVVFAINLSNRRLLRIVYQIINTVMSRGVAHRVGILPITLSPEDKYYEIQTSEPIKVNGEDKILNVEEMIILDKLLMNDFYKKSAKLKNGFSYLRYIQSTFKNGYYGKLWKKYEENPDILNEYDNSGFIDSFSVDQGYMIVNGVFHPFNIFDNSWQGFVSQQLIQDVHLLGQMILAGRIPARDDTKRIGDYIYEGLPAIRNTLIIPQDISNVKYKKITPEFLAGFIHNQDQVLVFANEDGSNEGVHTHLSLSLIGDFGSKAMIDQLVQVLKFDLAELKKEGSRDHFIKYRFVNTGKKNDIIEKLKKVFGDQTTSGVEKVQSAIDFATYFVASETVEHSHQGILETLQFADIEPKQDPIILLNSRMVEIPTTKKFDANLVKYFIEYERKERLFEFIFNVVEDFEKEFEFISQLQIDRYDWADLFFSTLTRTYYESSEGILLQSPRYHLGLMSFDGVSFTLSDDPAYAKNVSAVDIVAVIDPLEEKSQKIVSMLDALTSIAKNTNAIHLTLLLAPNPAMTELPIKRFYKGLYLPEIKFSNSKVDRSIYQIGFQKVPEETLFTLDIDTPHSWIALAKESKYDLDNIKLDLTEEKYVNGVFELENLIIEGYSQIQNTVIPPHGVQLELHSTESEAIYSDTAIMANFGYFQLRANPGVWSLTIKPNSKSAKVYSFADTKSFNNTDDVTFVDSQGLQVGILDMSGAVLTPDFVKNPGQEDVSLIVADDEEEQETEFEEKEKNSGLLSSLWGSRSKKSVPAVKKQADINIFAVASGHLYERLLSIMTASVRNHTEHTLKFWLIDNYMSANFKAFLPTLAAKYNFEYELITYKWPLWLRDQREKQRTIWGYKILFLDVLFPQDLDKVIFVDADQIIRTDLKELVDMDLEGAPYGYTPMCDSRKEMEGFRFWKQGYWKSILSQGNKKYHISALYVVDLKRFRAIAAGDKLRQHYQQLSADPGSLSNLDQDLPNNMQYNIKIHSLPQEWLWCETWCDDESLSEAKTIDLCNNPLTKEPKLDRARRQIPEWSVYDNEIGELMEDFKQTQKNEGSSQEDKTDEENVMEVEEEEDVLEVDDEENDFDVHDEL